MHYLALVTDYDETLASDGRVEQETMAAVARVRSSGRHVILATGRTLEPRARCRGLGSRAASSRRDTRRCARRTDSPSTWPRRRTPSARSVREHLPRGPVPSGSGWRPFRLPRRVDLAVRSQASTSHAASVGRGHAPCGPQFFGVRCPKIGPVSHDMLKVKRVYEPRARGDGRRILVDRLWPRGLSKEKAAVDEWLKEIAPSAELRRWFQHDPEKWPEFQKRYRHELRAHNDV